MRTIAIERKCRISHASFALEHLRDHGLPVIVTDATDAWPARSKWTFEFFKTRYGADYARAPLGLTSDVAKFTKLGAYIDYLDNPTSELPGLWVDKDGRPPRSSPLVGASPPYFCNWRAFNLHPELYDDIAPAPSFVQDLVVSGLSPGLRDVFERTAEKDYWAIYIGPAGSLSPLHRDYWGTHAYLAQIRGRKRAVLFSPEDSERLYGGQVDPEKPDLDRFPLFEETTAYECVLGPGETLFMPAGWWHHVRGLEKSITVSHNFFNDTNLSEHMAYLLQSLSMLTKNLEQSPDLRRELRIRWNLPIS